MSVPIIVMSPVIFPSFGQLQIIEVQSYTVQIQNLIDKAYRWCMLYISNLLTLVKLLQGVHLDLKFDVTPCDKLIFP